MLFFSCSTFYLWRVHGNRSFRLGYLLGSSLFSSHLARLKCDIPRSVSHKAKQAHIKCNIPRSLIHKAEQAHFKCNIPCS